MTVFRVFSTLIAVMTAVALGGGAVVPASAAAEPASLAAGPARFGVGSGIDTTPDGTQVSLAAGLGVGSARIELWWSGIEKRPGVLTMPASYRTAVDRLRAKGIRPVILLDYGNPAYDGGGGPTSPAAVAAFARYAGFVAGTFGSDVAGYEVWNEWPITVAPAVRGASYYVALTRSAGAAIRTAAPGAKVVGPAMSLLGATGLHPWLQQWLDAGGPSTVDVVSVHAYSGTSAPETRIDPAMRQLRLALVRQHRSIPVWWTEGGWRSGPIARGDTVTTATQAAYLVRWGALAARYGATLVMPFTLNDSISAPAGYGLYGSADAGYPARRSASAYAVLVRTVTDLPYAAVERAGAGGVWVIRYGRPGAVVRVIWATAGSPKLSIAVPTGATLVAASGAIGRPVPNPGHVDIRATGTPVFLRSSQ